MPSLSLCVAIRSRVFNDLLPLVRPSIYIATRLGLYNPFLLAAYGSMVIDHQFPLERQELQR